MIKKTLAVILAAAILAVSGCNGGTEQTTTVNAEPSEAWDFETYIEDIDFYMQKYIKNYDSAKDAFKLQDPEKTRQCLNEVLDSLNGLEGVIYPAELEDVHGELLHAVGLQKKLAECNIELTSYTGTSDELSDEELNSLNALNAEASEILTEIEDGGKIMKAWLNAKNAAFSYLPCGEYKAYDFTLETYWNDYVAENDKLYLVFFEGAEGDAVAISENCLNALSGIENMEVPESVRPYHDDIIEALSAERNYCLAIKAIRETNNEYPGLAFEELPADVQAKVEECTEVINNYYNEENAEYYAAFNAVSAASEFAMSQVQ